MFDLPRSCHNYFLEPITEGQHVKFTMMKRFINFTEKLKGSKKVVLKVLFKAIRKDTLSVTGNNLRNIMLLTGKHDVDCLLASDLDGMTFSQVPDSERWRLNFLSELIDLKNRECFVPGFTFHEYDEIVHYLCTS